MKFSFASLEIFRHHQPINVESMQVRVLEGLNGSFREFLKEEGINVDVPHVLVLVQHNRWGQI